MVWYRGFLHLMNPKFYCLTASMNKMHLMIFGSVHHFKVLPHVRHLRIKTQFPKLHFYLQVFYMLLLILIDGLKKKCCIDLGIIKCTHLVHDFWSIKRPFLLVRWSIGAFDFKNDFKNDSTKPTDFKYKFEI